MKVLFINGSPRNNGITARAMKEIERHIPDTHEVKWINCYEQDIKACVACLKCRPNNDCVMAKDDGHFVAEQIRTADRLIIGSPTYFGNISGPLKILIDRSLTAFESINANGLEMPVPLHIGKKATIVTACNIPSPYSNYPNHGGGVIHALQIVLDAGGYESVGNMIIDSAVKIKEFDKDIVSHAKSIAEKLLS